MKNFRDLSVWDKGHQLTLSVYRTTGSFPKHELYGLTSQIRRCCSSIPANIAEGCGRGSDPEFGRFLQIAMGSASELEYHLLLAKDLGFLEEAAHQQLANRVIEVKRMLTSLIQRVRRNH